MARITAPELEQFIVATVQLTGRVLGAGAYGSVEEVETPTACQPGLSTAGRSIAL